MDVWRAGHMWPWLFCFSSWDKRQHSWMHQCVFNEVANWKSNCYQQRQANMSKERKRNALNLFPKYWDEFLIIKVINDHLSTQLKFICSICKEQNVRSWPSDISWPFCLACKKLTEKEAFTVLLWKRNGVGLWVNSQFWWSVTYILWDILTRILQSTYE